MDLILEADAARDFLRGAEIEDDPLDELIAAAQGRIESFLGRPLVGAGGWPDVASIPTIVAHSVKLALADLYRNREALELTDDRLRPMIGRFQVVSFG